jgi:hopene-associated glycosyltransferase HpnB
VKVSHVLAGAAAAAWCFLAVGRGHFWRATSDGHVAIGSLVVQSYGGPLAITLVDDASDDGTSRLACAAASAFERRNRFATCAARPLRAPWTGKLNALASGVDAVRATRGEPDYWLFTDADIVHDPNAIAHLVAKARRDDLSLVSLMVRLRCESGWERLLEPAFVFFFQKLYPFSWSNDPGRTTAAAAGGCALVRANALAAIGRFDAIADRLIDDCALAAAVKATGAKTWLGLTARTVSIRPYPDLGSFWDTVKRTAFTQLDRSYTATLGATIGMLLLYVAPPAFTLAGLVRRDVPTISLAGSAWLAMSALYVPTLPGKVVRMVRQP